MFLSGRKRSSAARQEHHSKMAGKRAFSRGKSEQVFGHVRKRSKMLRSGLCARVSTNDQQTPTVQNRAMREYVARRGWMIAMQISEVNSRAARRQAREKVIDAARQRNIDVVRVWRLDRWGRSVTDLLAALQELGHLGVGFVSLTEALDLTTSSKGRSCGNGLGPVWLMCGGTGSRSADLQPPPSMRRKSGDFTVPASANRKSPDGFRSAAPRFGGSWRVILLGTRSAHPSAGRPKLTYRWEDGRVVESLSLICFFNVR